jgi:hypothetical protein
MKAARPFTVITFAADQTLLDFRAAMRAGLGRSLLKLRVAFPEARTLTVEQLITTRNRVANELGAAVTMEEIRRAAFSRTLAELGVSNEKLAAELTASYLAYRFRLARLYDASAEACRSSNKRTTGCTRSRSVSENAWPQGQATSGARRVL